MRCQCHNEGIPIPDTKDSVAQWDVLCRFAERSGVPVPTMTIKESKALKVRRPRAKQPKRNKSYKDSETFTEWRLLRYEALRRANGACECCGATPKTSGSPLHVDHIKPKSIYPKLEFDLQNLQVLCADCNIGKGNWDETDWRKLRERETSDAPAEKPRTYQ